MGCRGTGPRSEKGLSRPLCTPKQPHAVRKQRGWGCTDQTSGGEARQGGKLGSQVDKDALEAKLDRETGEKQLGRGLALEGGLEGA